MKKITSILVTAGLIITTVPLSNAQQFQIQLPPNRDAKEATLLRVDKFSKDKNLQECQIGSEEQTFSKPARLDEITCIIQKGNLDTEREKLPSIKEYRKKGVTGFPPKEIAPFFFEAQVKGIFPKNLKPGETISEANLYDIALRLNGYTIPPRASGKRKYLDITNADREFQPAIDKAIEIGILKAPVNKKLGLKKTTTRLSTLKVAYRLSLINLADESIISQKQAQLSLEETEKLDILLDVIRLIHNSSLYSDKLDLSEAIKAIVDSLEDPYSKYFPPSESKEFFESVSGKFQGIGAYIDELDNYIQIVSPLVDSPAEKAGVLPGDLIIKVNKTSTKGMTVQNAVKIIKGPAGTMVTLTIKRNGNEMVIPITRAQITVPALTVKEEEGVRILNLSSFNPQAVIEMKAEIAKININPPKALVINVQNNPGGFLRSVVQILDMFTEKGTVLVRTEYTQYTQFTQSLRPKAFTADIPIYVMINKGSASASEILAATMKDYGIATIVGSTSFGKGTVQTVNEFHDNSSAKITIAQWLSGKGSVINKKGVKPDVEAPDNPLTPKNETLEWILGQVNNTSETRSKSRKAIQQ